MEFDQRIEEQKIVLQAFEVQSGCLCSAFAEVVARLEWVAGLPWGWSVKKTVSIIMG